MHTQYIPPHPQKGTKYHRYVILLLPQLSPIEKIAVPRFEDGERLGFDVRKFMSTYGLGGNGGAHIWREVWDEEVSRIYHDILSEWMSEYRCLLTSVNVCYRTSRAEIWKAAEGRSLQVYKGIAEIYIRFSFTCSASQNTHQPPFCYLGACTSSETEEKSSSRTPYVTACHKVC